MVAFGSSRCCAWCTVLCCGPSNQQAAASHARLAAAIRDAAGSCVAINPAAANTFAHLQLVFFAAPGHNLNM